MGGEVVLLDTDVSQFGMRVRIALNIKGIKYEYENQDLEAKSSLLLQVNPVHKQIPVLIHDGKSICESLIIVQYIDEVWNEKTSIMPSGPYERAQARFWADYVDKKVFECGKRIWCTKGEEREVASKEFMECLEVLEEEIGDKSYFGGQNFGFIDLALIPFYTWFHAYEKIGKFTVGLKCPKLIAWAKRCMENESVSKSLAHPNKVYEFVQTLMN